MKIQILTQEESELLLKEEMDMKRLWSREQIINDAKLMMSMPDLGNTKWVAFEDREEFYKWLESNEAWELWQKTPYTLQLAKHFAINKNK